MYSISADYYVGRDQYDIQPIYSPDKTADGYSAYNIRLDKEVGKAGSLTFTIDKDNPAYDYIEKMGTTVYVNDNSNLIWAGRVLSISRDMYLNKTIYCEGALSFLNDIIVRPFVYPGTDPKVSLADHFNKIMGIYASRCSKKRYLDWTVNVPDEFKDPNAYGVTGVSSYVSALTEINNICSVDSSLGLVIDYAFTDSLIVTLAKLPFRTIETSIEFGVNMQDFSEDTDGSEVYSTVIPVTNGKVKLDGDTDYLEIKGLSDKYGIIERAISFDNMSDGVALFNACSMQLSRVEAMTYPKLELKAVDLYHLGLSSTPIDIGYAIPVRSIPHSVSSYYLCTRISMSLDKIGDTSYTFEYIGNPVRTYSLRSSSSMDGSLSCAVPESGTLADNVAGSKKKIQTYELRNDPPPDKIERSSNLVVAHYPGYSVKYEAEGTGDERHNFKKTIFNNTS